MERTKPSSIFVGISVTVCALLGFFVFQAVTDASGVANHEEQAVLTSELSTFTGGENSTRTASAEWSVGGVVHTGTITIDSYGSRDSLKTGSKTTIWVSDTGEFVNTTGAKTSFMLYAVILGGILGSGVPYLWYFLLDKARKKQLLKV